VSSTWRKSIVSRAQRHARVDALESALQQLRPTRPDARPMTMWIDHSSANDSDAGIDRLTRIGVGDAPKSGALFLHANGMKVDPRSAT
jgi:hypothetical protein